MIRCAALTIGTLSIFDTDQRGQVGKPRIDLDAAQRDLTQWFHDGSTVLRTSVSIAARIWIGLDFHLTFGLEEWSHHVREVTLVGNPAPLQELGPVTAKCRSMHWRIDARQIVDGCEESQVK
ncbi:hypothetical protein QOU18_05960 [Pseudomonas aeruginosa]|uniref:hypothetical protein n=1 Tax=Pseudomonas aeruginosa TaxID=287 RepID=UPI002340CA47|nr:hypothetical protein [Pseudomonas aeruginosa]MDC3802258.1 hypothetical protein [Pseudomonas aeruginosa]